MPHFVHVLVHRPLPHTYHYRVPEALSDQALIGTSVKVPFGRSMCQGLIMGSGLPANISEKKLKDIDQILPKFPRIPADLIALIQAFYTYYSVSPYKAFQSVIGNRKYRDLALNKGAACVIKGAPYPLTDEQCHIINSVQAQQDKYQPFYLHGITGSGKTEVYMQLADRQRRQGKSTLILVPEIALTPQYKSVFEDRFGADIALLHSGLTPKQREVAWNQVHQGQVNVVIGPRSAVFAPIKTLGLIIIDEEHENTYKQDNSPYYDAHWVAQFRARHHNIPLLLGSATPSVSIYANSLSESIQSQFLAKDWSDIHFLQLRSRPTGQQLPKVKALDLRQDMSSLGPGVLASDLVLGIEQRLARGEKSMIFLNRRGFSPFVICQSCHNIYRCEDCLGPLTYHQDHCYRCHRCHSQRPMTAECPSCHKPRLTFFGSGTQKISLLLQQRFPEAKIFRLDKDSAKSVKALDQTLTDFKSHGDILIGTQLIAKGHDIPTVSLVGIVGIDQTLSLPDYRSPERAFQLMTQVAGRAGRGEVPGEVMIQTYLSTIILSVVLTLLLQRRRTTTDLECK